MLIAFLGVVFMAVTFQLYLTNRSISRSLMEVHSGMLSGMFQYNSDSYEYNPETVKVIWSANNGVPSASQIPRVGLLQDDLPEDLHIYSHWVEQHGDPDDDCEPSSPPCKRTKAGGGLDAGDAWSVAADGYSVLGQGDYFGWLIYNGEAAVLDMTGLAETLQDVQQTAQKFEKVKECVDEPVGCAWDCVWGDCPWDD